MTTNSILEAITKLPRSVRVLSTNGIDETNALVLDTNTNTITKESKPKDKPMSYYWRNRDHVLEQKKIRNALPAIKEKRAKYAKAYYKRTKEARAAYSRAYYERTKDKR